jgi:Cu(I)/Ag(I) efflux system membrane protein CusA/SilA
MENVVSKLKENGKDSRGEELEKIIHLSVSEVSSAIMTGMFTTVVSFLPVFAMQAQEGKMFHPLAFTKTFALMSALVLGLVVRPTLAYWIFSLRLPRRWAMKIFKGGKQAEPRKVKIGRWHVSTHLLLMAAIVLIASTCSPTSGCP